MGRNLFPYLSSWPQKKITDIVNIYLTFWGVKGAEVPLREVGDE